MGAGQLHMRRERFAFQSLCRSSTVNNSGTPTQLNCPSVTQRTMQKARSDGLYGETALSESTQQRSAPAWTDRWTEAVWNSGPAFVAARASEQIRIDVTAHCPLSLLSR